MVSTSKLRFACWNDMFTGQVLKDYFFLRTPRGLEDVSKYPDLFAELLRPGNNWTSTDLQNLAGQNILRVMRRVEQVSFPNLFLYLHFA